jgi:hypothetical protein
MGAFIPRRHIPICAHLWAFGESQKSIRPIVSSEILFARRADGYSLVLGLDAIRLCNADSNAADVNGFSNQGADLKIASIPSDSVE